jgi:hypothetical protein
MTVSSALRRTLATFLFGLLTLPLAPTAASATDAPPEDPAPMPHAAEALPLAQLDAPALADPSMVPAVAPLKRSLGSLEALRHSLTHGDVATQTKAAHTVAVLATETTNAPHLTALQPALKAVAFNTDAPDKTRLMALSALHKLDADRALHAMHRNLDDEPSDRVRRVMTRMLAAEWSPHPGRIVPSA